MGVAAAVPGFRAGKGDAQGRGATVRDWRKPWGEGWHRHQHTHCGIARQGPGGATMAADREVEGGLATRSPDGSRALLDQCARSRTGTVALSRPRHAWPVV